MSFIRIVFCAFMVALAACSDEPIRTGPFHEVYHCDLTGLDYTNPGDFSLGIFFVVHIENYI